MDVDNLHLYFCVATNTWKQVDGGSSSGPSKYVVQGCTASSTGAATLGCIFPAAITAGHALFVCAVFNIANAVSFGGDTGSFTADPGAGTPITAFEYDTSNSNYVTCAYKLSATGGGSVLTAHLSTGSSFSAMSAVEIAGVTMLDKSDNGSAQNATGTAVNSTSITPAHNNDLVVGFGFADSSGIDYLMAPGANVSWVPVSGAMEFTTFSEAMQYYLQPTAAAITSQMTIPTSTIYFAHVVAFN